MGQSPVLSRLLTLLVLPSELPAPACGSELVALPLGKREMDELIHGSWPPSVRVVIADGVN